MESKYVDSKEISVMAECGRNRAREILNEVNMMARANGKRIPNKRKALRIRVLEYLDQEGDE